jgi:hypothetical protein
LKWEETDGQIVKLGTFVKIKVTQLIFLRSVIEPKIQGTKGKVNIRERVNVYGMNIKS